MINKIAALCKEPQNIRSFSAFLIGVLVTSLFYSYFYNNNMKIDLSDDESANKTIIAKVNNFNIYLEDISDDISKLGPELTFSELSDEQKLSLVKKASIQKEILKKALKYNSYKEYSAFLKTLAINETKDNYLNKISKKNISTESIKGKYQEIIQEIDGKKEYLVSHILTNNKKDIYKAKRNLNNKSFADVAKKFSIDTRTAQKGGEIGYLIQGSLIKEFEDEMLKLKKSNISKPFKTDIGWHIIKLNDIRDISIPEFKDVKDNIKKMLLKQERQNILSEIENNLKIKIY